MPSTFYALPLARRGESFLLQTDAPAPFSILVDAGHKLNSSHGATLANTIIASAPSVTKIDRLVLTHEDADHCGGASQFIHEWRKIGRSISQVWLPALWLPGAGTAARKGWNISRIVKGAFQAAPEIAKLIEWPPRTDHGEGSSGDRRDPIAPITEPFLYPDAKAAAALRGSATLDELFCQSMLLRLPAPFPSSSARTTRRAIARMKMRPFFTRQFYALVEIKILASASSAQPKPA